MGLTKSSSFTDIQNKRAALFKALGHPARMAIIEVLLKRQACICSDIVEELPLSQSTVSQHLRELKEVGIIQGEIEGTSVCYCINETIWNEIKEDCTALFGSLSSQKKCC